MTGRSVAICKSCFWAYPEHYEHIATEAYRRVDVSWQGSDVGVHDRLKAEADSLGIGLAELIRRIARQRGKVR